MDIRSFFSSKSGGGAGGAPSKSKPNDGGGNGGKKSKSKGTPKKSSGPSSKNKGISNLTMETTPKKKGAMKKAISRDDDGEDDSDDVVEEVVPTPAQKKKQQAKPAQKKKKTQNNINDDGSSSDGVVEVVPSPKKKQNGKETPPAKKSPRNTPRKRKVPDEDDDEDDEDGEEKGVSGRGRRAGGKVAASPGTSKSRKVSERGGGGRRSPPQNSSTPSARSKRSRTATRKVVYREDSDEGDDAVGGDGDDDDDDAYSDKDEDSEEDGGDDDKAELADTSSDEEVTPPPPKKPAKAQAAVAEKDSGGAGKKKSGGESGGGGFRPWMGGARKAPPNEGKKEVPKGAELCLTGKAFVVSGVLDSLGREAAEDLIKEYGGKVTGSVSSKTTYLLLGSVLDDGRPPEDGSKYKKAQQHKTKIIDEDGLFKMLRDSNPSGGASSKASPGVPSTPAKSNKPAVVTNPYSKAAVANPYGAKKAANPYAAIASKAGAGSGGAKSPGGSSNGKPSVSNKPGQMWVDKHKPQSSAEVIGHGGQVKKLQHWLRSWEGWHLKGTQKPPQGKENPGARAALLSGVPGVGKTSTATLLGREMGYHVLELNASDTRNKSSLSLELASVLGNQVLGFTAESRNSGGKKGGRGGAGLKKQLVIMDEVDGMGGSDRGGIQELIQLIKKTRVPIIAICNDRQHQKIRSLVNHCYDLRFQRPQKATIAKRVKAIAKMEGMDVDDNAAEMLVEANGNDIRQVLHALQMWSRKSSKLSYMNLKGGISAIEKDKIQRCGPFDAARSILGGARTPLRDRYEAFFTDYSLLPLLVHQNYLSSLMNIDPKTRTDVTMRAAAACSDADIISGKMRGDVQHWELLPAQAALNVRIGSIGGGSLGFPEFPKWLGNYSRENKRRRMLGELSTHLNASISGGPEAVRLSYMHYLKTVLTRPLRERGADGAEECVDMLEEYGLSRDDLFEIMPEFQLSTVGAKKPPPDVFACLDGKTKSAVTRHYNSISHKSQALVETMQAPKKSKKAKAPPKSLAMEGEDDDEEGADEEDEEDEEEDLSAFRVKGKAKSRASSGGSGGKSKAASTKPKAKKAKR